MHPELKIVIDANGVISSVISGGIPATSLLLACNSGSVYRPPEMEQELISFLEEWEKRCSTKKRGLSEKHLRHARSFFIDFLKMAHPHKPVTIHDYSRDKADNVYIAVALEKKAHFLISGDKDLLSLKGHIEGLLIVNPREFVESMKDFK